jgi:hypothetical protein
MNMLILKQDNVNFWFTKKRQCELLELSSIFIRIDTIKKYV